MSDIHIDQDGRRWRRTTGYSGHRIGPDGRMRFDVHTGQGRGSFWVEVGPPEPPAEVCDNCGLQTNSGVHKYVYKCEEKE